MARWNKNYVRWRYRLFLLKGAPFPTFGSNKNDDFEILDEQNHTELSAFSKMETLFEDESSYFTKKITKYSYLLCLLGCKLIFNDYFGWLGNEQQKVVNKCLKQRHLQTCFTIPQAF